MITKIVPKSRSRESADVDPKDSSVPSTDINYEFSNNCALHS